MLGWTVSLTIYFLDEVSLPVSADPLLKVLDNAVRMLRMEAGMGPACRTSGAMVGRQAAIIDEQDSIKAQSV